VEWSRWSGRLRVYHEEKEMVNLGLSVSIDTFNVGETKVQIESRLTILLLSEVTVRANGDIIFRRNF
jgi:hypothetical protein